MAFNISHNGKQITKINGKDVYAVAKPIANGIDWGANHGFDLFADILTRPLIKVYGEEPASWSWAKQPSNGTKYVDILRSMEWHIEGRNFITTDYVHQGVAGSQERFVVLEEKGVGGTYGLYSANPGAMDRGFPRDNEIYFIKGSPHGGGGSIIKKMNSGGGTFPEFNVSGGGIDWEFVPVTSISSATVLPYWNMNVSSNYKIWMKMTITFQDGTQTKINHTWLLPSGTYTDLICDFGNLNDVLDGGVKLQRQSDSPTSYPGIRFRLGFQSGDNNDWRWSMRRLSIIADGESASSALLMDDPYTNFIARGNDNEVFRYQVDRRTQVENWFKQFGYWKKKSF